MTLFKIEGKLPDGTIIRDGDVLMISLSFYTTISKVYEDANSCNLMAKGPGPYCFDNKISDLIMGNCEVKKVTPVDVYKFCKHNKWTTEEYLKLFK